MPLLADRVRETTTTVGTGTITLAGPVVGFQAFNTAFLNGDTVYYVIQGGAEWEIGIGTVGTGTLARTTVLQSSNGDALVPFSAGIKDVFVSYVADRAVTTSDAATLTNKTIDDYTNNVGANSTHFRIKATGTISKGTVVKATGFNPGEQAIEVAVVNSATDLVLGISEQALTAGQFGLAVVIGELFDVNTNGLTVGGMLYSNGSGGFTQTKPTSGTYQPLGWVVRANINTGVIAVNIVAPLTVEASTNTANTVVLRDGSGNFAAGTITATLSGTATQVSNALTAGTYLTSGGTYNGSAARTFAVDATDANTASKVVARDASGNFSAGTITATLNGAAPAGSLSGTTLAANVVTSSLTAVGTLTSGAIGAGFTAIPDSALATISTAGKVSNSATTAASANMANAIVARDASGNFAAGTITAALSGNASTATALQTSRNINGVAFNGTADITVTAAAGTLTGTTLASNVTASSLTSVGTLANLTVTNPISGSVTGSSGSTTGNAATATALQTARNINGVSFNGTADITVPAAAGTLTGNTLASGVTASSLTSVGTLSSLTVSGNTGVATTGSAIAGVGATSVGTKLNVQAAAGGQSLRLTDATNSTLQIDHPSSGVTRFRNGADVEWMRESNANVAFDTNTLYVDAVNNRVGVGTASPAAKLEVFSGNQLFVSNTTTANSVVASIGVYQNSYPSANQYASIDFLNGPSSWFNNSAIVFKTNGASDTTATPATEKMRLDGSGNLGLGVTPSAWSSTYRFIDIGSGGSAAFGTVGGTTDTTNNAYHNGTSWLYKATAAATLYRQQSGIHYWFTAPSGTAGAAITFTQAMTLDASGNLGVGTPSPTSFGAGAVMQTVAGTTGYGGYLGITNNVQVQLWANEGGSSGTVGTRTNHPILFTVNNTERARIDASGNFGIGITNPNFKLNVQHTFPATFTNAAGDYATMIRSGGTSENWLGVAGQTTTDKWVGLITNGSPAPALVLGTGGVERARIDASGNLLVGATANPGTLNRSVVVNSGATSLAGFGAQNNATGTAFNDGAWFYLSGTDLIITNYENAPISFATNNGERLRIKSTGQTRFVPLAAAPGGAENGDVYYDSTTNKLRVYAGGAWTDLH